MIGSWLCDRTPEGVSAFILVYLDWGTVASAAATIEVRRARRPR
jgi:hypothetical protein